MKNLNILLLCTISLITAMEQPTQRKLKIRTTAELANLCETYKPAVGPVIAALYAKGKRQFTKEELNKIIMATMCNKVAKNITNLEAVINTLEIFRDFLAHDSFYKFFATKLFEKTQHCVNGKISKETLMRNLSGIRDSFIMQISA